MNADLHIELFNTVNEIEPIYVLKYQQITFWTNRRIGNIKTIYFGLSDNIEDITNYIIKKIIGNTRI